MLSSDAKSNQANGQHVKSKLKIHRLCKNDVLLDFVASGDVRKTEVAVLATMWWGHTSNSILLLSAGLTLRAEVRPEVEETERSH
jgi:hypothetical protein